MHRRSNFLPKVFVLLLLLAGGWAAYSTHSYWLPLFNPNLAGSEIDRLPPDDRMAREAILQGVQAFYSFDSQTGKEPWLENLCQSVSQSGCKLIGMGADRLWESLGTEPFTYSAEVEVLEKVSDRPASQTSQKASQVWKTSVTLNQPLPGSDQQNDTVYALVVTENNQWRFERFLTEQESAQFQQEPAR